MDPCFPAFLSPGPLLPERKQPGHEHEKHQGDCICRSRDRVFRCDGFMDGHALKPGDQGEFEQQQNAKSQHPDGKMCKGCRGGISFRNDKSRSNDKHCQHDGNFQQFGGPDADHRNNEKHANRPEQESGKEHQRKIEYAEPEYFHGLRTEAASLIPVFPLSLL